MASRILATVNRTDAAQVAAFGRVAWLDMVFNPAAISVEAVERYCQELAKRDGIKNPEILVREVATAGKF